MLRFLVFSLARAWQGFWRNAAMSIAATATMTLMLLLLSGFFIVQNGLLAGLQFVEQKVEVVADLRSAATDGEIEDLRLRIGALPEVRDVTYVSREEALQRFRDARAAQGEEDLTKYLDANPLHASLEVKLRDPADFAAVTDALRADPLVERVKNITDLVSRVLAVTEFLRTAGIVILALIAAIVLFIIINTIRLAVVARAEEIEVMRLVGASDAFIRWPFVFEGALVGLLGAAITLGVIAAMADPLSSFMFEFFRVLPIRVGAIARDVAVLVIGSGVGLGVLGAFVSVRTYLIR
ncbi:MAG TPA: permease-like cell division protein FtsX [Actinomycetota bacterium]|nr:permease-like cell division protein FtsX [Actinomycetota bacterium]HLE78937.1 permease-like cell division protein FtsX [Candidatus Limnocylindrales bacterium]